MMVRTFADLQISNVSQALNLLEHLYQPNLLILLSRMLAQMQIQAVGLIHPNRSLMSLCLMLTLMNGTAALLHLLDYMAGPGKGLMLDFVGQGGCASSFVPSIFLGSGADVQSG